MGSVFAGNIDLRAVAAGTVVGALSMTAALYVFYGGIRSQFAVVGIVMGSFVFVSVPAGIVTGLVTRSPREQTREGGIASVFGTGAGVLFIGLVSSVTATHLPFANRFDLLFLAAAYGLFTLAFIVPATFLVGGWVSGAAYRSVDGLFRTEDDWGEIGRFRD